MKYGHMTSSMTLLSHENGISGESVVIVASAMYEVDMCNAKC